MTEEERKETQHTAILFGVVFMIFGLVMFDFSARLLSAILISAIFVIIGIIFLLLSYFLEIPNDTKPLQ